MITFLIAFSFECFQNSTPAAISVSGVSWFLVILLIIWRVFFGNAPAIKFPEIHIMWAWSQVRNRCGAFIERVIRPTAQQQPRTDNGASV